MGNGAAMPSWQAFLPIARRILQAERLALILPASEARPLAEPPGQGPLPEFPGVAADRFAIRRWGDGLQSDWFGVSVGSDETDGAMLWAQWPQSPTADQVDRLEAVAELARTIGQGQSDRAFGEGLSRTLTHELRTPLTVIQGYLDLLIAGKSLPKGMQDNVFTVMRQQTGRLQHLIREFAQAGSGRELSSQAPKLPLPDVAAAVLMPRGISIGSPPVGATLAVSGELTGQLLRSLAHVVQLLCKGATPPHAHWETDGHELVLQIEVPCPEPPLDEIRRVLSRRPAVSTSARPGWSLSLAAAGQIARSQGARLQADYQASHLILRLCWPLQQSRGAA